MQLTRKQADGYVISLGPINLVNAVKDTGMIGCGAYDVSQTKRQVEEEL